MDIHDAIDKDNWIMIEGLSYSGHSLDEIRWGKTPLIRAVEKACSSTCSPSERSSSLRTIRILLDLGAHSNIQHASSGFTPLHIAAAGGGRMGCIQAASLILKKVSEPSSVKILDSKNRTPLQMAAGSPDPASWEMCELLLDHGGGDLRKEMTVGTCFAKGRVIQSTPMHRCAATGHPRCLKWLLSRGCNVDAKDTNGWTPLHSLLVCAFHRKKRLSRQAGQYSDPRSEAIGTILSKARYGAEMIKASIPKGIFSNGNVLDPSNVEDLAPPELARMGGLDTLEKLIQDAALPPGEGGVSSSQGEIDFTLQKDEDFQPEMRPEFEKGDGSHGNAAVCREEGLEKSSSDEPQPLKKDTRSSSVSALRGIFESMSGSPIHTRKTPNDCAPPQADSSEDERNVPLPSGLKEALSKQKSQPGQREVVSELGSGSQPSSSEASLPTSPEFERLSLSAQLEEHEKQHILMNLSSISTPTMSEEEARRAQQMVRRFLVKKRCSRILQTKGEVKALITSEIQYVVDLSFYLRVFAPHFTIQPLSGTKLDPPAVSLWHEQFLENESGEESDSDEEGTALRLAVYEGNTIQEKEETVCGLSWGKYNLVFGMIPLILEFSRFWVVKMSSMKEDQEGGDVLQSAIASGISKIVAVHKAYGSKMSERMLALGELMSKEEFRNHIQGLVGLSSLQTGRVRNVIDLLLLPLKRMKKLSKLIHRVCLEVGASGGQLLTGAKKITRATKKLESIWEECSRPTLMAEIVLRGAGKLVREDYIKLLSASHGVMKRGDVKMRTDYTNPKKLYEEFSLIILRDLILVCRKTSKEEEGLSTIEIIRMETLCNVEEIERSRNVFELHFIGGTKYFLAAKSKEEKDEWVSVFGHAMQLMLDSIQKEVERGNISPLLDQSLAFF